MAQTAIEWLLDEIEKQAKGQGEEIPIWIYIFCEEAKEMHKQDCENAWMDGFDFNSNYKDFEDYYNQTFNQ